MAASISTYLSRCKTRGRRERVTSHQSTQNDRPCDTFYTLRKCIHHGDIQHEATSINYHPQSGWYDESPQRGLVLKPCQSHLLLAFLFPFLIPNVLSDYLLL